MAQTTYSSKCEILAELWTDYRDDEEFADFIDYNDLGLPLAYAIANGIVESNDIAEGFVQESFRLLILGLEIEDTGFENLSDILLPEATE
jgi:hypothetical protein